MLFVVGSSGILAYITDLGITLGNHTVLFRIELSRSIRSHSEVASLRHGGALSNVQQLAGHASCLQRSGRSKAAATPSARQLGCCDAVHVVVLRGLRARSRMYWLAGKRKVEHLLIWSVMSSSLCCSLYKRQTVRSKFVETMSWGTMRTKQRH